ncbi:hypothetical protein BJX61DRAFT_130867 [Aspergillus egyptiacus]|nr:hypothetical protein BJX61DRAFT_130867 [Aspergillus egyptiacus]
MRNTTIRKEQPDHPCSFPFRFLPALAFNKPKSNNNDNGTSQQDHHHLLLNTISEGPSKPQQGTKEGVETIVRMPRQPYRRPRRRAVPYINLTMEEVRTINMILLLIVMMGATIVIHLSYVYQIVRYIVVKFGLEEKAVAGSRSVIGMVGSNKEIIGAVVGAAVSYFFSLT